MLAQLDRGADPNLALRNGDSPLMVASRMGMQEVVDWLLGLGARVNDSNRSGETALILADTRGVADGDRLGVAVTLHPLQRLDRAPQAHDDGQQARMAEIEGRAEALWAEVRAAFTDPEVVEMTAVPDQMKIFDTLGGPDNQVTVIDIRAGLLSRTGGADGRPEIYTMGLRNPYRIKYDEPTGRVYIGIVGPDEQTTYDWYDVAEEGGENFGWPRSTGRLFYTQVPFGSILGPLFYVLVALAALTSTISLLEVVASYLIDEHDVDFRRFPRVVVAFPRPWGWPASWVERARPSATPRISPRGCRPPLNPRLRPNNRFLKARPHRHPAKRKEESSLA